MFDKETMTIVEIVKATPEAMGGYYDFPLKLFTDLSAEAAKRGISQHTLEHGVNRLPTQGLAVVYRSRNGTIHGIKPTDMFRNLFS